MRFLAFLLAACIAFPATAAKEKPPRILIVVDASASMATSWPGQGGDRMGAVRTTLDILDAVFQGREAQPQVAVRIFGDRLAPTDTQACNDTRLVRPWAPADQEDLGSCLDSAHPLGAGSLARALEGTLSDLQSPSKQDLVLIILDGLNRCPGDLQKAFSSLTLDGDGAEVHIFGFGLTVTDQAELSTYASFHSVGRPAQLAQGLSMAISQRMSLPLMEESIGLDLAGIDRMGFGPDTLDVVGTWSDEPITVDLSREKPRLKAGLGSATVIAARSDQGQRQHIVRIPVVPERRLRLEFFEPAMIDLSVQIQESGWGRPGILQASWHGAPEGEIQLVLSENGVPGASWLFAKTVNSPEGVLSLPLPTRPEELALQLRKPAGLGDGVIAAVIFDSPGRSVTLEAPEQAEAGGTLVFGWDGESYPGDLVTLVPADAPPEAIGPLIEAVEGSPRDFLVPFDQCSYEIRYIDGRSFEVLARTLVEVKAATAGLLAPPTATGSETIDVRWWGPAGPLDVITLTEKEAEGAEYLDWASPADGSPARLRTPQAPGAYEIRYVAKDSGVAAAIPLKVQAVAVSLDVPETVRVGERLRVAWTGPSTSDDFLVLVRRGKSLNKQLDFAYVSIGSPTTLAAPDRPGVYEVRYIAAEHRQVLATATVTVVK